MNQPMKSWGKERVRKNIIKWALKQLVKLYHSEPSYEMLEQFGVEDMISDGKRKEITIIVRDR